MAGISVDFEMYPVILKVSLFIFPTLVYYFTFQNKLTLMIFRRISVAERDLLSLKSQIHLSQALKEACATLEFVVLFTALQIKLPASITL